MVNAHCRRLVFSFVILVVVAVVRIIIAVYVHLGRDRLGVFIWPRQRRVLHTVRDFY